MTFVYLDIIFIYYQLPWKMVSISMAWCYFSWMSVGWCLLSWPWIITDFFIIPAVRFSGIISWGFPARHGGSPRAKAGGLTWLSWKISWKSRMFRGTPIFRNPPYAILTLLWDISNFRNGERLATVDVGPSTYGNEPWGNIGINQTYGWTDWYCVIDRSCIAHQELYQLGRGLWGSDLMCY